MTRLARPNTRVQRTRSSASPPHSPLTRSPLGSPISRVILRIGLLLLLVFASRPVFAQDGGSIDACAGLIPRPLVAQIDAQFPEYRLPFAKDWDPEDVKYSVEHGGSACLGITGGGFHTAAPEIAVLLGARGGSGSSILVVARALGRDRWEIQKIYEFPMPIGWLYAEKLEPGKYVRSESAEGALDVGELAIVNSAREGILAGKLESWALAFFFLKGSWIHVRIAD